MLIGLSDIAYGQRWLDVLKKMGTSKKARTEVQARKKKNPPPPAPSSLPPSAPAFIPLL